MLQELVLLQVRVIHYSLKGNFFYILQLGNQATRKNIYLLLKKTSLKLVFFTSKMEEFIKRLLKPNNRH
jgi:hypothetical protein